MSTSTYRRSPGERRPGGRAMELRLHGGAYGGQMVARDDGRVVFVQGGIPGETVRAQLTVEKKTFAEARATHVVVPAHGRAFPPCPYFSENGHARGAVPGVNDLPGKRGACGGCQYQHLDYETQLALKRDIVADLMHRQARLPELEVLPAIASPSPWRYRNRARWMIDDAGRPCYHQASSERLLAVQECHIIQPILASVLSGLDDEAWRLPLRTLVSEITARTATAWDAENTGGPARPSVLLVLHPRPGARRRDLRLLANDLGAGLRGLDGVVATSAGERSTSAIALWGDGAFDARFAGYRFRLSPLTFFQVNEPAAAALVELVIERLGPLDGKSVADVYSGAGTFALPIAARAERVLAVENDPTAWPTYTSYPATPRASSTACPRTRSTPPCSTLRAPASRPRWSTSWRASTCRGWSTCRATRRRWRATCAVSSRRATAYRQFSRLTSSHRRSI
jgi:23S rRNA (uracil1939-C5)-methyltransferase